MKNIPSLRHLIGFEAAARLGNFSRAADELHLSQSAISHQIQQLEEQLGQPMFHRVGRGVELTVAGEVLLQTVQKSLHTLHQGLNRITTYLDPGLVVVVAPAPFMQGWLQAQINEAQERDHEFLPVLSTDQTARFIDEVDVDIHISAYPLQQANLEECPLFQDEWIVVATPTLAQKIDMNNLENLRLFYFEKSLADDSINNQLQEQLNLCKKVAFYDDICLLINAIKQQEVIACVPYSAVANDLKLGVLMQVPNFVKSPSHTWWIARMGGKTRSPKVLELFNALCLEARGLQRHS
ncbi:LysR family transcriptional regulator [Undibacterium sp. Di24W]|uniref:LysR family transcriptional regulator n=1 Tax=Undibacterium sp. Di24W TaxID=3413033 RepID=UPI003BF1D39E